MDGLSVRMFDKDTPLNFFVFPNNTLLLPLYIKSWQILRPKYILSFMENNSDHRKKYEAFYQMQIL